MTVIAGVDVGNATTEVVLASGGTVLASGRVPTRGRKGSPDSLRAAAALVRRLERQAGAAADEARIAPLRPVDTGVVTVPDLPPSPGRLRVLAAGVPTPGGAGEYVGRPVPLDGEPGSGVVLVPPGMGYAEAAARVRAWLDAGFEVGAVLVAGDEGVLVANRLPARLPVIDQAGTAAAAACALLAVEIRPAGLTLTALTDPVALGARLGLDGAEPGLVATCRSLADYSNAVVGLLPPGGTGPGSIAPDSIAPSGPDEPWVLTRDGRLPLREACRSARDWAPGTIRAFGTGQASQRVDDLFAVDLAAAAESATARAGSVGRAILTASLLREPGPGQLPAGGHAGQLAGLLSVPVHSPLTEPSAARLGALTTPGASDDALVIDLGAGTIDVIGPAGDVVAAGAGELLTAAVAALLGVPRAAADWVKRGPCVRVDGGQRYEAEDGSRGFLDGPAPASAAGMLVVSGPGGWLPFDGRHGPGEWRALRIRIKQAVMTDNVRRAVRALGQDASQVLVVGGPAADEELLTVLGRSLPDEVGVGRGNVGGALGPRYAVAVGLTRV